MVFSLHIYIVKTDSTYRVSFSSNSSGHKQKGEKMITITGSRHRFSSQIERLPVSYLMIGLIASISILFGFAGSSHAIPTLQIGAPAGPGDSGIYADYADTLAFPAEEDTAVTGGNTILVAAAYKQGVVSIGGKGTIGVHDWSYFGFDPVFNGKGALLMATVPNGTLSSGSLSISVDGGVFSSNIYSTSTFENGFKVPNPPSNHAPIQNQDYLFFDIGNFSKSVLVPNFVDESFGSQSGQIKSIQINTSGYEWIHFDVFALVTDQKGNRVVIVNTDDEGNPGSHDVTWKTRQVPEPSTLLLLGSSLLGIAIFRRRKI